MTILTIELPTEYLNDDYKNQMIKVISILTGMGHKDAKTAVDQHHIITYVITETEEMLNELKSLFYTNDYVSIIEHRGAKVYVEISSEIKASPKPKTDYATMLSEIAISAIRNGDWVTAKTIITCIQGL